MPVTFTYVQIPIGKSNGYIVEILSGKIIVILKKIVKEIATRKKIIILMIQIYVPSLKHPQRIDKKKQLIIFYVLPFFVRPLLFDLFLSLLKLSSFSSINSVSSF